MCERTGNWVVKFTWDPLSVHVTRALSTVSTGRALCCQGRGGCLVRGASAVLTHCPRSLEASSGGLFRVAEAAGQPLPGPGLGCGCDGRWPRLSLARGRLRPVGDVTSVDRGLGQGCLEGTGIEVQTVLETVYPKESPLREAMLCRKHGAPARCTGTWVGVQTPFVRVRRPRPASASAILPWIDPGHAREMACSCPG